MKELDPFDCLSIKQASTYKHLQKHSEVEQNGICLDLFAQLLSSPRCSSVQPGEMLRSQLCFPVPQPLEVPGSVNISPVSTVQTSWIWHLRACLLQGMSKEFTYASPQLWQ